MIVFCSKTQYIISFKEWKERHSGENKNSRKTGWEILGWEHMCFVDSKRIKAMGP